jgi:hypothetical protein
MKMNRKLGTISDLKSRSKKAFSLESQWESLLSDTYEYFLPNRNLFDRDDVGQKKMDLIFDSTAPVAIQVGASKLQENIAPIWSRWAIFELSEEIKRDIEASGESVDESEIKKSLDQQTEIVFDYINRSNFATQFYEAALDLLIGTCTIMIQEEEDDDKLISFHSIPQKFVGFEEGPDGKIETHWRKHKVKARNILRTWKGFVPSAQLQERIKTDPDGYVSCTEGVVFLPDEGTYHGVVWADDEENINWYEDYKEASPFVSGRYSKTSGEVRGRGPAIMVLPDVKSLNKAKEFVLQKAAIDISGMWTATDDGVMNPYNITIAPGVVLPVGSNNSSNPSIARLDTSSNVQLPLFEIEELQNAIKQSLFNDLRDPQGPVRSATEIAIDSRELAKRIGSAYGRLQTEVLVPILKRVMGILVRRGKIDPIVIDGKAVDIKFTSPLARAQDMEDILAVQQAVEFVLNTAGPDQSKMAFKLEDFGTWAAEKTGMPAELVRSQAEKAQVIQAGARAAEAGMDVQAKRPTGTV